MNNLEELQKEIRSKLPRLMEVERGCVLDHPFYNEHLICIGENTLDRLVFNRYDLLRKEYDANVIQLPKSGIQENINGKRMSVLGKDILLSHVLEWLNIFGVKRITYEGSTYTDCFRIHDVEQEGLPVTWNLSKLHLKDQNQELIDYLHSLIKK